MNRIIWLFILTLFFGCKKSDKLRLTIDTKIHSQIDTLYQLGDDVNKCLLLEVTDSYGLGHIDFYMVVSKQISKTKSISYKILVADGFSKEYIAIKKSNPNPSVGWFLLEDGKLLYELPSKHLLDSLRLITPKNIRITTYGDKFIFRMHDTTLKTLDYGNLVTKFKELDFDNFDYSLYKLKGDSLIVVSKDGDDILKQKDGIFFIPKPGYGIINRYSIKEIINALNSVSKLSSPPNILEFMPVK